jgi:hypothetical protein
LNNWITVNFTANIIRAHSLEALDDKLVGEGRFAGAGYTDE